MSTRSNIAIELPNKKIKVIYVHSDGYPYGIGKILNQKYSTYKLAKELFNFGDASYLDDTIETCSFYGRDWGRDLDPARTYRDEWMFMRSLSGDIMIEYLYLFKNGIWHVSEQQSVAAPADHWDGNRENLYYWTKYIPLTQHKDFETKHEKHAEVKMIADIGKLLSKNFGQDNVVTQGWQKKKAN
jgi:hypothetical protein